MCDENKARKGDWGQAEHISAMKSNSELYVIGSSKTSKLFLWNRVMQFQLSNLCQSQRQVQATSWDQLEEAQNKIC